MFLKIVIATGLVSAALSLFGFLKRRFGSTSAASENPLPQYLTQPTSNSHLIAAGVASLAIAGTIISLTTNTPEQKIVLAAPQMAIARNTLQNSLAGNYALPQDLSNQYFFKAPQVAANGTAILAKASYFINNNDGTYTMRTISLDEKGHYIGDPTSTLPLFITDGPGVRINPEAQSALMTQKVMLEAAQDPTVPSATQVAAINTAAAQSHGVTLVTP